MAAASRVREPTKPSATPSFCRLTTGYSATAVPTPARATITSRMPPMMTAVSGPGAGDVVRIVQHRPVEDQGRDRDEGDHVEHARDERGLPQ